MTERRTNPGTIEVRAEGDKLTAVGYAAVFNARSQNLGGFVEQVSPGAFAKTLQEADVRALVNHDPNLLIGRSGAGTLRLEEDGTGLRYEIDLPDTSAGRDLAESLKRGDMAGSSFGFRTIDDEWGETEQGFPVRTLKQVALRDVGPVTFPAYLDTDAALRSLADSHDLDLDEVRAAAAAGELRSLIVPGDRREHRSHEKGSDGRETPTVAKPRISWLYA